MKASANGIFFFAAELVRILDALEKAGIVAMPFKGPVLTQMAYGDLGLRSFADLDFLIHKQDIPACLDVLQELGYAVNIGMSPAQKTAYEKWFGEYMFFRKDRRVVVEPHWAFERWTLALAFDYPGIWQRARPVEFVGTMVLSLSPEDLVTTLCVHGSKHQWERLQWICDVAEILRVYSSMDWHAVFDRARSQRCMRMLLLGLTLANRLRGAMLPAEAEALLAADRTVANLAGQVERSLFSEGGVYRGSYRVSQYYLQMRDRFEDKISYVVRTITTPQRLHFDIINLPSSLFFGYYLIKLLRDYILLPLHVFESPVWRVGKSLLRKSRNK